MPLLLQVLPDWQVEEILGTGHQAQGETLKAGEKTRRDVLASQVKADPAGMLPKVIAAYLGVPDDDVS